MLLPLITWATILGAMVVSAFLGRRAFLSITITSAFLVGCIFLVVHVPGWRLRMRAVDGDPQAQYEYARWLENHSGQINAVLFWPETPDVLGGYFWLEKAAKQDYPPALFAIGTRLKYGIHVPRPAQWSGPAGNVFPQPYRGQRFIDRARELGYEAPVDEELFYWTHYRKPI